MVPSSNRNERESLYHWVVVRPEPSGQFTAQVMGLPEVRATAASRSEALQQIGAVLAQWIASGNLTPLAVPRGDLPRDWPGHDPADPMEQEFLADLERFRREDLEDLARLGQRQDQ
ncbi:MAG: type II toxin-antitoxin system HicB family antitoxin [Gemmataceae bacterium]